MHLNKKQLMKFYIRIYSIFKYINWCLVFDNYKIYWTSATNIRNNMNFIEINI